MTMQSKMTFSVGLLALMGILAMLWLAFQVSGVGDEWDSKSYEIKANFSHVGSLRPKAPVSMAGVRIGRVKSVLLDKDSFEAIVVMNIEEKYHLPDDTSASIATSGLLGEQYINLEAGASDVMLVAGGEIMVTQSALRLENIIGKFVTNFSEKKE